VLQRIVPVMGPVAQAQLLQSVACVLQRPPDRKATASARAQPLTAAAVFTLSAFRSVRAGVGGGGGGGEGEAVEAAAAAELPRQLLAVSGLLRRHADASAAHWRAAAELAALATRAAKGLPGHGSLAAEAASSLIHELRAATTPASRAAAAVAVGAVWRAAGGMALAATTADATAVRCVSLGDASMALGDVLRDLAG
jgi:hypothetical protein